MFSAINALNGLDISPKIEISPLVYWPLFFYNYNIAEWCFMAENQNPEQTKVQLPVDPENLRVKYNSLAAYNNSVVTFRFTVLGLYLTAIAIVLAGTPSPSKYFLLIAFTISLWTIEIRNRTIKNDRDARAKQIEAMWDYTENNIGYNPYPTKIFWKIIIPPKLADSFLTHSNALDLIYFSVFLFSLYHLVRPLFG